jgi:transcriptional regulator NrdR family protein
MTNVIKKGGGKQRFSPSKLKKSIDWALKDAKVAKKKRDLLVKEVGGEIIALFSKRKLVKTTEIRNAVLKKLVKKSKAAVAAWKRSEKKKRKKAVKKRTPKRRVHHKRKVVHHRRKRRR